LLYSVVHILYIFYNDYCKLFYHDMINYHNIWITWKHGNKLLANEILALTVRVYEKYQYNRTQSRVTYQKSIKENNIVINIIFH